MQTSFKSRIVKGLFWSMAQSWGGRVISFLLFLLLARLLSPSQFGLVASATVVLSLMEVLYEQGFGDALVQKADLSQQDLNGVFFLSLAVSLLLCAMVAIAADRLALMIGVTGVQSILVVAGLGLPVAAAGICQQALYRRQLEYRWLAVRTIGATALSGLVGVCFALKGFGAWSLVAQGLAFSAFNTVILWSRPLFRPSWSFDWSSFSRLWGYSCKAFGNRLIDFGNTRVIELLIVMRFGAGALGIYVVGSKIYQTLLQLLSSVVLDVAHSGFSQIAGDRDRMLRVYYASVEFTAAVAVPCFVILASVSQDATRLCFGSTWSGAAPVMQALCLLGALQCIQFYNGTCFNASGRPGLTLLINAVKISLTVVALLSSGAGDIAVLSARYVVAVSLVAPLSFWLGRHYLGLSLKRLLAVTAPYLFASLAAFGAGLAATGYLAGSGLAPLGALCAELAVSAATYCAVCLMLAPRRSRELVAQLLDLKARSKSSPHITDAVTNKG